MPKGKSAKEMINDSQLREEIERFIAIEYPLMPSWVNSTKDVRNRNVITEYNRLTKIRGLSKIRAKQILAHLIGRSYKAVEKILF
jgi:hypothetical protein